MTHRSENTNTAYPVSGRVEHRHGITNARAGNRKSRHKDVDNRSHKGSHRTTASSPGMLDASGAVVRRKR